jgi:predicted transposase YbfD/YdcC/urease gamma subunit
MPMQEKTKMLGALFSQIADPRMKRGTRHNLLEVLLIIACGFLVGLDDFEEIEEFAWDEIDWFKTFLKLKNGVPSHDTMRRILSMIDAEVMERSFTKWSQAVCAFLPGDTIALDGKTMRGSHDKNKQQIALHVVSAWAANQEIVLGQSCVDSKSNEITAIPKLLEFLHIPECVVTIDAMGCQREIARVLVEDKAAHYIFSLKGNHETMHEEVKTFFEQAEADGLTNVKHDFAETFDKGHGRLEHRRCWIVNEIEWFEDKEKWASLNSFIMIKSKRTIGEKTTEETRYFISSLPGDSAAQAMDSIRKHWGIENKLHWRLDVSMGEDACRLRAENLARMTTLLRKITLNTFSISGRNTSSLPKFQRRAARSPVFRKAILFGETPPAAQKSRVKSTT